MLVTERFYLPSLLKNEMQTWEVKWGFGEFSKAVFNRTYSRAREDGSQERWNDTVIRVVEGAFSILKNHYKNMGLRWDERLQQATAKQMAKYMFHMRFLPPGRGLWAMGTDYIYERGSAALNNCGYCDVDRDLVVPATWAMDMLMMGVGVGFGTLNARVEVPFGVPFEPLSRIPDSREGWVESVGNLLANPRIAFDYSAIRPAGSLIRGFGGVSSGPEPLRLLHERIREYQQRFTQQEIGNTQFVTDVMNAIGACVVAGNVRRSAELATGSIYDTDFLNLKNYDLFPERSDIGWMSNNSVVLEESDDFSFLPSIAERIRDNGEPGVINLMNVQKYGRFKEKKVDYATGFNP